jgi:hypothetical protein
MDHGAVFVLIVASFAAGWLLCSLMATAKFSDREANLTARIRTLQSALDKSGPGVN